MTPMEQLRAALYDATRNDYSKYTDNEIVAAACRHLRQFSEALDRRNAEAQPLRDRLRRAEGVVRSVHTAAQAVVTAVRCECGNQLDPTVWHDENHRGEQLCEDCCPHCATERDDDQLTLEGTQ